MRSALGLGAAGMPQSANLTASASVDFPLPRAPMMQVRPWGTLTLRPGRNPPLISIFSTSHISSNRQLNTLYTRGIVWSGNWRLRRLGDPGGSRYRLFALKPLQDRLVLHRVLGPPLSSAMREHASADHSFALGGR